MSSNSQSAQSSEPSNSLKADLERQLRAQLAQITGGMAPDDYTQAWWEWYLAFAQQPDRQVSLAQSAMQKAFDSWQFAARAAMGAATPAEPAGTPFGDTAWSVWPFNVYAHSYTNWKSWMQEALGSAAGGANVAAGAGGDRSAGRMRFATQQLIDAMSPANFLHTNPELLKKTVAESGQNLVRGFKHWLEDAEVAVGKRARKPGPFQVGRDVAVTPGKVVFRNRLIELLQYSPQTPSVYAEPVLITPAWIMKYYILDLSPRNSLVRFLVEKGHTVFVISWKNPGSADRDLGIDDYVELGFDAALDTVKNVVPNRKVHAVGYCIGGTLLSIAASRASKDGESPLASITLLAALTDFSEPGELSVFISPSQLAMLEAVMHKSGVLESERMGAAFAMLRARDLLWAPAVDNYLRGERAKPNDLMAWNADGTRMPWRMHSEYLDRLYLKNELAAGAFTVRDAPVNLANIRVPMFVVGTETDHVAPWRAVFKVRGLTRSSDFTFLLTSGGHNAGIVSGPAHPKRRHRMHTWTEPTGTMTAQEWFEQVAVQPDSWWPAWQRWLAAHSSAERQAPPHFSNAAQEELEDAPGSYVRE